jgi:predicted RNA-binding Zn ribbon-like protein
VSAKESEKARALFLAGHSALDFLNTQMRVNEDLVDLLKSDEDVLIWLRLAGFPPPAISGKLQPLNLLRPARTLRESIRSLVKMRKAGRGGNPSILNYFLAAGQSCPQLIWGRLNKPKIETLRQQETAESILAPVAESAADLLANANFELIRRCEGEACGLWFSDQTKSHQRRWCSMEICGNRHKVTAYRARRRDQSGSRE